MILMFCNHLAEEERANCFTSMVVLLSSGYQCPVSLLHSAMGWPVGISWSYSLSFESLG